MSRPERSSFDAALRFELASEEDRPLFVSYLVATVLATTWLVLVHATPSRLLPAATDFVPPIIIFEPQQLPSREAGIETRTSGEGRSVQGPIRESLRNAFSGNTGLVDAGKILRGVEVAPAGSTTGDAATRVVGLETGVRSHTPGRTTTPGLSVSGNGLGTVSGRGISRNAVTIAAPEVRAVAAGPTGISSEVGQTARAHAPQLERCYHQEGLSRNAALAGLVRLAITVEGGRVTSARVVDRTWSGAGAAETEGCLVRMARGWRLGTSDAQIVLPLSFTSPGR